MRKIKIILQYDEKANNIMDMFLLSSKDVEKIAQDIDGQIAKDPTISKVLLYCMEKYEKIELLLALSLVFNVCFVDFHIQREINLAMSMARCGARMPGQMQ